MPPPPRLAECVECIWISETTNLVTHRVLPDGCADIIYVRGNGRSSLRFVGPMTRYEEFPVEGGSTSTGIRFRSAMWTHLIRMPGAAATDRIIALEDLWGSASASLLRRLDSTENVGLLPYLMVEGILAPDRISSTQRAIQVLEQAHGQIPGKELAVVAGLSERQFRRRCIEAAGLTPKLLARILRFRRAQALLPKIGNHAGLAAACGYFDQSHLIAEFRLLSGRTPTAAVTTAHRPTAHTERALQDC